MWIGFALPVLLLLVVGNAAARDAADDLAVLEAHNWFLVRAHASNGAPLPVFTPAGMDPIALRFDGHGLSARGCNALGEHFDLDGQRIVQRRSDSYLVTQTLLGCSAAPARADDAVLVLFNGNPHYELSASPDGPLLVLESPAGMTVVFKGEATAETRYGSSGEAIFFDVAPRNVRCIAPGRPDCNCLQVRELFSPLAGSYSAGHDEVAAENAGPWQLLCEGSKDLMHVPIARADCICRSGGSVATHRKALHTPMSCTGDDAAWQRRQRSSCAVRGG